MHGTLAPQRTIIDLIAEYDEKVANVEQAIAAYEAACTDLEMAGCVMGTYAEPLVRGRGYVRADDMRRNLLKSGWKAIYGRLNIDRLASASDKRLFERMFEAPPPLTPANVRAQFKHYYDDPRGNILRGMAEVFSSLDPAYRSHAKVKVGVKGLPKRVILSSVGSYGHPSGSYGRDRLRDIINALAAYRGEPLIEYQELADILDNGGALRETRGVWLKRYANGNGHLYFDEQALLDINRALAEFYGDVLPDVDPEQPEKAPITAVSKDLQFYWTPEPVVAAAIDFANIYRRDPSSRVLEPSCGDGRILDGLHKAGCDGFGIEYHAGRADVARAKGHAVLTANFLECPPRPEFDAVVMNPPFYGRHYVKHVRHALKFLKPGGTLVSILPATAHYDHKELQGDWRDLPVASFAEAGTNVPTGLLRMRAQQ